MSSLSRFTISTGPRGKPRTNSTSRSSKANDLPPPRSNNLDSPSKFESSQCTSRGGHPPTLKSNNAANPMSLISFFCWHDKSLSESTKTHARDLVLILGKATSSSAVNTPSGAFQTGSSCNLARKARGGATKSSSLPSD
nr:hypothetical protein Itr_chr04CG18290 [Ipomoea trifida]GLL49461.1 hypothetical protein Itr_chr15CG10230 [Ipomoea trifida]